MNTPNKKNWVSRNWKWAVPAGCLTSILLFAGFFAAIIYFVFSVMKSSDVYKDAISIAKNNTFVQKSIGTPINEGFLVSGNISINNNSGRANLSIPINGPKGEATIFLVATKSADKWIFSTLVVEISKSKTKIDLIESTKVNGKTIKKIE